MSGGSLSGLHLESGTAGVRIEGNTHLATAPSTDPRFGGIRLRDGVDVTVSCNVVTGPWTAGLSLAS